MREKTCKNTVLHINRNKQRIRGARLHEKITNIKKDCLHKISHEIISEN